MEITQGNLSALFTNFDLVFQCALEAAPSYYEKIASVVKSGSSQTVYPWLGQDLTFREWLGNRVYQALRAHTYTIFNKKYESSVLIQRDTIEDDEYGVYTPMIERLGEVTKSHPDSLVFSLMKDAVATPASVIGYDGAAFFGNHNVGLEGGPQTVTSNLDSGGTGAYWFLIDASRSVRPFIFQSRIAYEMTRMNTLTDEAVFERDEFRFGVRARGNVGVGLWQLAYSSNQDLSVPSKYGAARAAMRSIKTDGGYPFGALSKNTGVYLVVPPSLEEVALQLLHSEFGAIEGAGGAIAAVPGTNTWKGSAELIVSEWLA